MSFCSVIDPVTLTFDFQSQNHVTFIVYPKVIPYTKFEHFVNHDHSYLSCDADKQTDGLEHLIPRRPWIAHRLITLRFR